MRTAAQFILGFALAMALGAVSCAMRVRPVTPAAPCVMETRR